MNSKKRKLREPTSSSWGWYVVTCDDGDDYGDYLQNDINIHESTQGTTTSGTTTSGYFRTKEDAKKAIDAYNTKWDGNKTKTFDPQKAFDRAMRGI